MNPDILPGVWIKKKKWWYIPTMEYFSLIKNEQPT